MQPHRLIAAFAACVLAAGALWGLSPVSAAPVPIPASTAAQFGEPTGQILFESQRDGDSEIYVIHADGSNVIQLTYNTVSDKSAAWSPDGRRIVYTSGGAIYVMNADGSSPANLTPGAAGDWADWSPDGTQIAFESDRDGDFEIYVMNTDGGNVRQLTYNTVRDTRAEWSPDGSQIAFLSEVNGTMQLFVMGTDGSSVRQLTVTGEVSYWNPDWSPDGSQIAIGVKDGAYPTEIHLMNADGSNLRPIAQPPIKGGTPSWSPDGQWITFTADRDQYVNAPADSPGMASDMEVFIIRADGTDMRNLTSQSGWDGISAWRPAPAPAGTAAQFGEPTGQILFESQRNGDSEIYVMNADGSSVIQLTHNNTVSDRSAAWSPDGSRIVYTSGGAIYVMSADGSSPVNLTPGPTDDWADWSPDGTQIAFESDRDGDSEIYVMNADGSNVRQLTKNTVRDTRASWSPDGSQIAFLSEVNGTMQLFVMGTDGSSVRQLTITADVDYWNPDWSPDGSQIAIGVKDGGYPTEIYLMNADGSNLRPIAYPPIKGGSPSWSPDGQWITFTADHAQYANAPANMPGLAENMEVLIIRADGTGLRNLTNNPAWDGIPDWQPPDWQPVPAAKTR